MKFIVIIICVSALMLSLFLPTAESCSSFFGIRRKPFLVQEGKRIYIDKEWLYTGSENPTTTEVSISDPPTTDNMKIEVKIVPIYESDNDEDSGDNLTNTAAAEDIDESEKTKAVVAVVPETDPVEVVEDKDSEIVIKVEDFIIVVEGEDPVTEVEGKDPVTNIDVEDPVSEVETKDPAFEVKSGDPVPDIEAKDPVTEVELTAPSDDIDAAASTTTTTIEETTMPEDDAIPDRNVYKTRYEHIEDCDDLEATWCLNGGTCFAHYSRNGFEYQCECKPDIYGRRCEHDMSGYERTGHSRTKQRFGGLNKMRKNRRRGFKKTSSDQ